MTSQNELAHLRNAINNPGVDWDREQCIAHLTLTGWEPFYNSNVGLNVLWNARTRHLIRPIHIGKTRYASMEDWGNNIPSLDGPLDGYPLVRYTDQFLRQAVERTLEIQNEPPAPPFT